MSLCWKKCLLLAVALLHSQFAVGEDFCKISHDNTEAKRSWNSTEVMIMQKNGLPITCIAEDNFYLMNNGVMDQFCRTERQPVHKVRIFKAYCDFVALPNNTALISTTSSDDAYFTTRVFTYNNAASLYLLDSCMNAVISNSTVKFRGKEDVFCSPHYSFINSTVDCSLRASFETLLFENSQFEDISSYQGMFTFKNSSGQTVSLHSADTIHIINSKLESFSSSLSTHVSIINSSIGILGEKSIWLYGWPSNGTFTGSHFGEIHGEAVEVVVSTLHVTNTTIKSLNAGAFTVILSSEMVFRNIAIDKADAGFIKIDFTSVLLLDNVTVAGKPITEHSEYIHYITKKSSQIVDLLSDTTYCERFDRNILCDFKHHATFPLSPPIDVESHNINSTYGVHLSNYPNLQASLLCPSDVIVVNVTGGVYLPHLCPEGINLNVINSKLELNVHHAADFYCKSSDITDVHLAQAAYMDLRQCAMHNAQFNLTGDHLQRSSTWQNSSITRLQSAVFVDPVVMDHIVIESVNSIVFDHVNDTSKIRNSKIVSFEGTILVKSGVLEITDTILGTNTKDSTKVVFEVKEGAKLKLKNATMQFPDFNKIFIYTDTSDQVEFLDDMTRSMYMNKIHSLRIDKNFTHIAGWDREGCSKKSELSLPSTSNNLLTLLLSRLNTLHCSYKYFSKSKVVVSEEGIDSEHTGLEISDADEVTVSHICSSSMEFNNIMRLEPRIHSTRCLSNWTIYNSVVTGIFDEMSSFVGYNFVTPFFISGSKQRLRNFEIHEANITGVLAVVASEVSIVDSRIRNVSKVDISKIIKINNVHLTNVCSGGIVMTGESYIVNSTFGFLHAKAVVNYGNLLVRNTHFDSLSKHSFVLLNGSKTIFENVNITEIDGDPFLMDEYAHFEFRNVIYKGNFNMTLESNLQIYGATDILNKYIKVPEIDERFLNGLIVQEKINGLNEERPTILAVLSRQEAEDNKATIHLPNLSPEWALNGNSAVPVSQWSNFENYFNDGISLMDASTNNPYFMMTTTSRPILEAQTASQKDLGYSTVTLVLICLFSTLATTGFMLFLLFRKDFRSMLDKRCGRTDIVEALQ